MSALSRFRALVASSHPGPSVAVTLVVVVLAISAGLDPWRVALLGAAVLFNQLSVGLSNDWIDAERDRAVGRTDKPVAVGAIPAATVRTTAWVCAALSVALTAPLGPWAVVAHAVALLAGWHYNAWLKSTAFSVVPYVLFFGLLPAIVTLSLPVPVLAAWWALGSGALLGIAAHFANVLPDLEDDRATGVRGLPHRLGARASGIVIALSLVAASALLYVGSPDLLHVVGFIAGAAIAAACVALVLRGSTARLLFQLIIAAALLDVVLLAVSGGALG